MIIPERASVFRLRAYDSTRCVLPNCELSLRVNGKTRKVRVLFDTGADTSLMSERTFKELGLDQK